MNTRTRTTLPRRAALVAAAAATGLLLTACGGGSGSDSGSGSGSAGDQPKSSASATKSPGAFNDADVMFAQMMIPHHEQALEMSKLSEGRASDAEVKKLATEIEKAQDPEIRTMKSWLKAWGKPVAPESGGGMDHGSGHGGGHGGGEGSGDGEGSGMAGMMSEKDMAELKDAKGADFDRKFAELMIAHHEGAIEMAEEEQQKGRNATAKKLAGEVIEAQQAEVDQLKKILDRI